MRPVLKYIWAVIRFLLIILNNLYCIPTHVLWLTLLLPARKYVPALYYRIEQILFSWLLAMVSAWSWSAGYNIVEVGADITECLDKRTLVMVNHQSTADVPMLMAAFNAKPNVLQQIMWIMDRAFQYTNFGIVSSFHLDFFIASGKTSRDASIERFRTHLRDAYLPRDRRWMVLFPEGGFLRKRREVSQRFAAKMNLPLLEKVTLPRMGALFAIRDILITDAPPSPSSEAGAAATSCDNNNRAGEKPIRSDTLPAKSGHSNGDLVAAADNSKGDESTAVAAQQKRHHSHCQLDYILDITIAYPGGKPLDLWNIIHGLREPCDTYFYYRLYSTKDIPVDDAQFSTWVYDRFIEKESLLTNFYKSNTFEVNNNDNDNSETANSFSSNIEHRNATTKLSAKDTMTAAERGSPDVSPRRPPNGIISSSNNDNKNKNNSNNRDNNNNSNSEHQRNTIGSEGVIADGSWRRGDTDGKTMSTEERICGGAGSAVVTTARSSAPSSYVVQQDLLRFIILHIFFITSTYFHLQVFSTLLDYYYQVYAFTF